MKPLFAVLRHHYPSSELREELYARIGWSDLVKHPAFQDTCAIHGFHDCARSCFFSARWKSGSGR